MNEKARHEANRELLRAHNGYQQLLREGYRFELAKQQNNDILPGHLFRDWQAWRRKIKEVDEIANRIYK